MLPSAVKRMVSYSFGDDDLIAFASEEMILSTFSEVMYSSTLDELNGSVRSIGARERMVSKSERAFSHIMKKYTLVGGCSRVSRSAFCA